MWKPRFEPASRSRTLNRLRNPLSRQRHDLAAERVLKKISDLKSLDQLSAMGIPYSQTL